jgi:hypothetical protein
LAKPVDVLHITVVAGGDHGNTAFQFGASVSAELSGGKIIYFEVSLCKLICRKDTGSLIESTILPTLTSGLKVVATSPLHIYYEDKGSIQCKFGDPCPATKHAATTSIPHVNLYITGDLAFQAMALGKESMLGHWCMQCTMQMQCTLTEDQLCEVGTWTMDEYCRLGDEAERQRKGKTQLGVKQKPWWPFIPVSHYMIPLLHCMIGVGNQLLDVLRDIINEQLENLTLSEEKIHALIPLLKQIIAETAANWDLWDNANNGKNLKTGHKLGAAKKKNGSDTRDNDEIIEQSGVVMEEEQNTHTTGDEIKFKKFDEYRNKEFVKKLEKDRVMLRDQMEKLKTMRTSKVKDQQSIETKISES